MQKHNWKWICATAALGLLCTAPAVQAEAVQKAFPATHSYTIDISGIEVDAALDDPSNTIRTYDLDPNAVITGVTSNFTLTTFSPSWASELAFHFTGTSPADGVTYRPASGQNVAVTDALYDLPYFDFTDNGSSNVALGPTGILTIQFYDTFNDSSVSPDARIGAESSITVHYYIAATHTATPVPITGHLGLLLMGTLLAGAGAVRLRRKNKG